MFRVWVKILNPRVCVRSITNDESQNPAILEVSNCLLAEAFGGEDSLKANLLGNITEIIIASNGNPELIEQNIGLLALSFAGEWAGGQITSSVNGLLGTEENPLVDALGALLNIGIASGWDSSVVTATAFGPVLGSLTDVTLSQLPDGGAEGFIARSIEVLVASFARHNGDTDAISQDIAIFLGNEFGNAALNNLTTNPSSDPLTVGDSGERVAGVQHSLIEHGYLQLSDVLLGEFNQATARDKFENATAEDFPGILEEIRHDLESGREFYYRVPRG